MNGWMPGGRGPAGRAPAEGRGDHVVRRLLKTIIPIALVVGSILIIARHGSELTGIGDRTLLSLVSMMGFLVLVGAAVLRLFRDRFSEALHAALLWVIIGLVLVIAYAYRFELKDTGERVMAELVPGRVITNGSTVEIARAAGGDFQIATQVNGVRVPMVLDTGATSVMLTRDAAIAAGLPMELIKYSVNIETANGRAQAAPVTIDRIAVGGIVERSVPALIAQPGQLKTSLLGMSFLKRLQGWEVRGDRVVLHGAP
jgi:aspartyl protease family protein